MVEPVTEQEAQRRADQEQPLSDPSALTTANLLREIRHLRELLEGETKAVAASTVHLHELFAARFGEIEVRLVGMDQRYEQRYTAQVAAIDAAFASQQVLNENRFQAMSVGQDTVVALATTIERLTERIEGLDHLTDAKFVTFRTLVDSESTKVALALASSDKAVNKAEVANEKRFESVNEFRAQLNDQAATFVGRTEANAANAALAARVDAAFTGVETSITDLKARMDRSEGRSGGFASSGAILIAAVGFLATLITIVTGIILVIN